MKAFFFRAVRTVAVAVNNKAEKGKKNTNAKHAKTNFKGNKVVPALLTNILSFSIYRFIDRGLFSEIRRRQTQRRGTVTTELS